MAVLVVDDAAVMRMVIKDILVRSCAFEKSDIVEASGGKDAIRQYTAAKPEFVLCDISMPDISGIDLVRELIKIDPNAKIIMCTSSSDESDIRECITAGAKDYISKPPKPERVVQAIERITGRSFSEPEEEEGEQPEQPALASPAVKSAEPSSSQKKEIEALRKDVDFLLKEVAALKERLGEGEGESSEGS